MSPTIAEGNRIYREACEENSQWNKEASPPVRKEWEKWTNQLKNVRVTRILIKTKKRLKPFIYTSLQMQVRLLVPQ